jgi:hypothetical protein
MAVFFSTYRTWGRSEISLASKALRCVRAVSISTYSTWSPRAVSLSTSSTRGQRAVSFSTYITWVQKELSLSTSSPWSSFIRVLHYLSQLGSEGCVFQHLYTLGGREQWPLVPIALGRQREFSFSSYSTWSQRALSFSAYSTIVQRELSFSTYSTWALESSVLQYLSHQVTEGKFFQEL